ncbi:MAG TPA: hypothetical protein VMS08_01670 [Candidatus Saccharimonadia bacterium]|nr:hypothetical protein [Candidatus Saccharimonadia bacterium]
MKAVSRSLSLLGPIVVIGAIIFFVYYSLEIYKPNGTVACQKSAVAQQVDVAVNVVREWFGQGQTLYKSCPK